MPHVVLAYGTVRCGPGADEVGTQGDDSHDKHATPIVPDEIYGFADGFELPDDPGDVVLFGRGEVIGYGTVKAGQCQGDDVVAGEVASDTVPDVNGIGDSMNENSGH